MKLSIVTTLYYSRLYVEEFYNRISQAAKIISSDFEIIFVNDGSPDDSLLIATNIATKDPRVLVVDLSRNFGHHKAIMTGLAHANGDLIFLIDSDLEEEPEWLNSFHLKLIEQNCDVVYGVQPKRKGSLLEKFSGFIFYRLINALTNINLSENLVTARLMTRRYVKALLTHEEREIFLAGLWATTGFDQKPMPVTKHSSSATTYSFTQKLSLVINAVTAYSNFPLVVLFYLGLLIFGISGCYSLYLVVNRLFWSRPLDGWTSLMTSIWLLGGIIISFLGLIGLYISKIFVETKRRPYTIVRSTYRASTTLQ